MIAYITRRILLGILILVLVTVMVFLVMRLLPGDPLTLFISQSQMSLGQLTSEQLAELRHQFGLDKPLMMQYIDWIGGVLRGNLGKSIFYTTEVSTLMAERMPVTLYLGVLAFVLSSVLGILFGVVCAVRRGKWIDAVITVVANIGITIPSFWFGILLIYVFSLQLHWLPTGGYVSPFADLWESLRRAAMPVLCLALFPIASLTRQTRSSVLEVIKQDYVRTAWAKGLSERMVVFRHMLKNSLIPVVTVMGVQVSMIFGGSVLIETVFNIPGMGRLLTQAVFQHDYMIVQAGVLIVAVVVVLSNLIVDISYGWLDPRIRYG
ncbi:MAG: ABC transporter permease [Dehalococcoidales bacterium]|nr:ABC transporter permease [Dehalococcoidales bacterium]